MNMNQNQFWNSNSSSPLFFEGEKKGETVLNSSVPVRMAFLRKVYGILSIQLAMTTLISGFIMFMPSIQMFFMRNSWLMIVNLLANVVITFPLISKRHEYPLNFQLMGAFTVLNSLSLGIIISQYDLLLVTQAFFLTSIIVVGLTMYTLQSTKDFQWLGGLLYSALIVSAIGGFLHIFFRNSAMETFLSIFGAFIFAGYIIYDTQLIMKHLSAEEYVIGVLNLYMDIINLFVKILRILNSLKQENNQSQRKEKKRNN